MKGKNRAVMDPETRKSFDRMQKNTPEPECFGRYGEDNIVECSACPYHPDCKTFDPVEAKKKAVRAKKAAEEQKEKDESAASIEKALVLMGNTKKALGELKIKYKDDASYPELKKLLNDALDSGNGKP